MSERNCKNGSGSISVKMDPYTDIFCVTLIPEIIASKMNPDLFGSENESLAV